jgi:predicted small secreted protein
MAFVLPITNYPDSTFNLNTATGVLKIRTYWSGDIGSKWLCDIYDANGDAIVTCLALVTGCDNLLQGIGKDILIPYRMVVYSPTGKQNNTVAGFGTDCQLLWMEISEGLPDLYA